MDTWGMAKMTDLKSCSVLALKDDFSNIHSLHLPVDFWTYDGTYFKGIAMDLESALLID